jgi:hypothetical protein
MDKNLLPMPAFPQFYYSTNEREEGEGMRDEGGGKTE